MDEMQFTQIIPRIRVWETRLLDKARIDRMVVSSNAEEALKVLQDTDYSFFLNNIKRPEDYEIFLGEELKRVYSELYNICPVKAVVDIMALKYDYHNIKVLLKARFLKRDFSKIVIPIGTEPMNKLKFSIDNQIYRDLNPIMRKGIEEAVKIFEEKKDPQIIDIILDKYLYENMLSISKGLQNTFIEKFLKASVDLNNIKTFVRVKRQNKDREFLSRVLIKGGAIGAEKFLSMFNDAVESIISNFGCSDYAGVVKSGIEAYMEDGSFNTLEKLSDGFIISQIKRAKYISFGPEPIFAYIYAKENEIMLIRIIMVGKINKLNPDVIRERLRDNYV